MGENVITRAEGGAEIFRPAEDAKLLGSQIVDQAAHDAAVRDQQHRKMFENTNDRVRAFAEGVVDALSMGIIRDTSETAAINRDVNSGWAMAGNVLGFAAGMAGGPVRAVTHGAEAAGRAAAKQVLRAGEGSIATRAVQEAAAGAALGGGQAFGHAMMDSILEDKEFTSEAILHEAKLGGLIGGVGGVLIGGLGKLSKATRKDIAAQGGIIGDLDEALKPHYEALSAYDAVVQRHAAEVGVLRELHARGELLPDFLEPRVAALRNAARTRDVIDGMDLKKAFSGTDDVAYRKFQKATVQHRAAVRELDAVMQVPAPDPHASIRALDDIAESLPPIKDATPTEPIAFADEAAPVDALPGFDDAKMARMKAKLAETAGERAKFKDMANGGNLVEPAPAPALRTPDGKRNPDAPTGELRMDEEAGVIRERRAILNSNDLPDIAERGPATGPAPTPPDPTNPGRPSAMAKGTPTETPMPAPDVLGTDLPDLTPQKPRPLDAAEARVQQAMAALVEKTGGRLDSAGALNLLERAGIRPSADNVGAYMDQVYALRKAGVLAADEARGVSTGLRGALEGAMAGAVGHAVGGPLGAVAAVAADLMYLKRGGRLAAASGRLMGQASAAAEKLLTSKRVRITAGALASVGANTPHAYSERGPIKDPVERIQEVQFLAANPDTIRERVAETAKDLADQPQLLAALQDRAVNQVQRIALRAPAILFDKLNRPLMPPAGKLREFYEYENAVHDLPGVLKAIGAGVATKPQIQALQENWPSVHVKLALGLMADQEQLKGLARESLRMVEQVTGAPLSNASDPSWLMRQAAAWVPPAPPTPPGKPQAFNINPAGAPTPSQSNATGRAPGN